MNDTRKVLRKKEGGQKDQSKVVRPGQVWSEWGGPDLITNYGDNLLVTLLYHELSCPGLVSVDILCSYIKHAGVGPLWGAFKALSERNVVVPVRIITTTQHQLTEAAALDALATLPNLSIKVVVNDNPTFHAKSWLFKRPCSQAHTQRHGSGCSCGFVAVVGSSNMSNSALTQGFEWNLRVAGIPRVTMPYRDPGVDLFAQTFNHYWNGGDDFWSNKRGDNVVTFHPAQSQVRQLVVDRLRKRDPANCDDPACQMCLQHRDHVQQRRAGGSRPTGPPRSTTSRSAPAQPTGGPSQPSSSLPVRQPAGANPPPAPPAPLTATQEGIFLAYYAAFHGGPPEWLGFVDVRHSEPGFGLEGSTLLHCAAYGLQLGLVEDLLRRGARADAQDARGNTPLHRAAQSHPYLQRFGSPAGGHGLGLGEVVRCLLDRGRANGGVQNVLRLTYEHYEYYTSPTYQGEVVEQQNIFFSAHGVRWPASGGREQLDAKLQVFEECRYPKWERMDGLIERLNNQWRAAGGSTTLNFSDLRPPNRPPLSPNLISMDEGGQGRWS